MAGAKLSPRQKMINLMYLVFIAMLALNMSKEVLTAFGLMNEKFIKVNNSTEEYNLGLLESLEQKASDDPTNFEGPLKKANQIKEISKGFYDYLSSLKNEISKEFDVKKDGKLPFEKMDKSNYIDEMWFEGDNYSKKGNEIMAKIEKFKKDVIAVFGNDVKYRIILEDINKKFDLSEVIDNEGKTINYLSYHFKSYPAIASITKLTSMQNDIQYTEQDIYNALIGNTNANIITLKNFKAMVMLDKNVFFQGENVTGKVVIGKYDKNTVPTSFSGPGKIENGQAIISMPAGGVGEKNFKGVFTFMEDGKPVPLPFDGKYIVVARPKSATISADKMNVVYRVVPNPMTISFAGISPDKVSASAPGLSSLGGGKYVMKPLSGSEVVINVTGTLPDGSKVSDKMPFRIKEIPRPTGTIRGEMGVVKGPKSSLEIATIGAKMVDFDFEVGLSVNGFKFKVPGQATVTVSGNKLDAKCKAALSKAVRGDQVTIFEISTSLVGAGSYLMQQSAPVFWEIQ